MRTSARFTGAAAAAAATALLLGGCSSGSDESGSGSPSESSSQAPQDGGGQQKDGQQGDGQKDGDGQQVDTGALEGGWATGLSGDAAKDMLLLFVAKDRAVLTGKAACSGTIATSEKPVTLDLTCQDGADYTEGTVKRADADKLAIEWSSGETSELVKTTDGEGNPKALPSDLPTALPSGIPTDPADLGN